MELAEIVWNKKYEIGIEDIDVQHHYFANLINRLGKHLREPGDLDYKQSLIYELNAYARFHFISEENLMKREGYPQLAEHKEHHIKLIERMSIKQNQLMLARTEANTDELINFMTNWFLNHTNIEDRQFADYWHARHKASAA